MDFLTAVNSIGFPAAMCVSMLAYMKYQSDVSRSQVEKLIDAHAKETERLATVVENNTSILNQLVGRLGKE